MVLGWQQEKALAKTKKAATDSLSGKFPRKFEKYS
jgi:hypothetical protein